MPTAVLPEETRRRWLVEPRRPEAVRSHPGAPWLAVAAVCVGAFMGQLDASIVTVGLPNMERAFGAPLGAVTWVALSYLVVLVATVAAAGRLSDMAGRKLLYLYGFAVFTLGSLLCALAPDLGVLIACRVLQAVGAAMLQANSVAIIALAVPRRALGRAIGIQGAAQAAGLALGPSVGGLLLALGGWRLLFVVNVPVGVVGIVLGWAFIPRSRDLAARTPFDLRGLALCVPACVLALSLLSLGATIGWLTPTALCLAVGAVALSAAFVRRQHRAEHPLIPPSLFHRPGFTVGIVSGLLGYLVLFGVLLVVPFYLERGTGLGSAGAGLRLMALPLALALVAPLAGRMADRIGARPVTVTGLVVTALGLVLLAGEFGTGGLLAGLAVAGAGLGMFIPANNATVMGAAPVEQSGVASGVLNMTRGLGTALGLALTGLVFTVAGGAGGSGPAENRQAFSAAVLFLAVAAVAAALVAARHRAGGPASHGAPGAGSLEPVALPVEGVSGPAVR